MEDRRIKLGISIGDINGIGMEVIIKALSDARIYEDFTPIVYGSLKVANYYRKLMGNEEFSFHGAKTADDVNPKKANILNVWTEDVDISPGAVTEAGGTYAFKSLEAAVMDLASNKIDVLVTAPINKKNIQSEKFNFPGHTEYLAKYANVDEALMLMISEGMRIGTVTGHIPLQEVSTTITKELILKKLDIMNKTLQQDFSIQKPKIAVLGLNPHSGDNGLLGMEEITVIAPAIEEAKNRGILALGPYPADGFFGSSNYSHFDGILAMYHDQGLIPFKAITFDEGVNFTAGLPIVRTSPDHGTAYEIAGKNKASENSFRQAMYFARDIFNARKQNRALQANALESKSFK